MPNTATLLSPFQQVFSHAHELVCHAPGRVNLIGDHTDYNQGLVLPAAINFGTDVYASKRNDRVVRACAWSFDGECIDIDLDNIRFNHNCMWVNYVAGCILMLQRGGFELGGANLLITGNIPQGGGLSSSASLEIALIKTFAQLFDLTISGVEAAKFGQQVENDFVGCNCGIMDQLASAMGAESKAIMLDCQSLSMSTATIPSHWAIMIINSNVKRGLVESEYNLRREQCELVAAHFGKASLRCVTMEMLEAELDTLNRVLYQRARHVISENERVLAAKDALDNADMTSLSDLMFASHVSLRDDFATSVPAIDKLVTILADTLRPDNSGGARITGGGFGGCVVAIVERHRVEEITQLVATQYPLATGLSADVYVCEAAQGAFR
ncbi:MAG TPA: galactokinase [Idiomarina baltica]|uniref:Galactokinase n=2 Tax=Alteromonadales TaxID=135622 RepID=A0A348WL35_9GAMM|nr:galactokinase [Alteromonas macleodii]MAD10372.1 galactokinase [Alteromonas sp.]HAI70800.1 galactokinase [Alteromonas australica]HAR55247.1 galactokinase [Idiomarina baltica]|tara:strand:+ start:5804 stop:6952 length:1149 start_codon:yes stop_codon:yes gene_type:complete